MAIYTLLNIGIRFNKLSIYGIINIMTKKVKNILRGMGGALDICPRTDYARHLSGESDLEKLGHDWQKVGHDIQSAMRKISYREIELRGSKDPLEE